MEGSVFTHERLEAYKVAREFLALAQAILDEMPRGSARLRDQLADAAESALLNCAEGAGRRSGADKARFFDYARGSAEECAAALDAIAIRRFATAERVAAGRALLHRAVRLLAGLARSASRRPS
jgi:four helix bundle protein